MWPCQNRDKVTHAGRKPGGRCYGRLTSMLNLFWFINRRLPARVHEGRLSKNLLPASCHACLCWGIDATAQMRN